MAEGGKCDTSYWSERPGLRWREGSTRSTRSCVRVALTYLPPRHFAFFDSTFATVVASDASGAQTMVDGMTVYHGGEREGFPGNVCEQVSIRIGNIRTLWLIGKEAGAGYEPGTVSPRRAGLVPMRMGMYWVLG